MCRREADSSQAPPQLRQSPPSFRLCRLLHPRRPYRLQRRGWIPFRLKEYFNTLQEYYRVRVPREGQPDILLRHPFLYKGEWGKTPVSLEFSFTREGIPIGIYPSDIATEKPEVIRCTPMPVVQKLCTAGRLNGKSTTAHLTSSGQTFINRFIWREQPAEAQSN